MGSPNLLQKTGIMTTLNVWAPIYVCAHCKAHFETVTLLNEHAAENGHGSLYRLLMKRRENIRIDECLIKGG